MILLKVGVLVLVFAALVFGEPLESDGSPPCDSFIDASFSSPELCSGAGPGGSDLKTRARLQVSANAVAKLSSFAESGLRHLLGPSGGLFPMKLANPPLIHPRVAHVRVAVQFFDLTLASVDFSDAQLQLTDNGLALSISGLSASLIYSMSADRITLLKAQNAKLNGTTLDAVLSVVQNVTEPARPALNVTSLTTKIGQVQLTSHGLSKEILRIIEAVDKDFVPNFVTNEVDSLVPGLVSSLASEFVEHNLSRYFDIEWPADPSIHAAVDLGLSEPVQYSSTRGLVVGFHGDVFNRTATDREADGESDDDGAASGGGVTDAGSERSGRGECGVAVTPFSVQATPDRGVQVYFAESVFQCAAIVLGQDHVVQYLLNQVLAKLQFDHKMEVQAASAVDQNTARVTPDGLRATVSAAVQVDRVYGGSANESYLVFDANITATGKASLSQAQPGGPIKVHLNASQLAVQFDVAKEVGVLPRYKEQIARTDFNRLSDKLTGALNSLALPDINKLLSNSSFGTLPPMVCQFVANPELKNQPGLLLLGADPAVD